MGMAESNEARKNVWPNTLMILGGVLLAASLVLGVSIIFFKEPADATIPLIAIAGMLIALVGRALKQ